LTIGGGKEAYEKKKIQQKTCLSKIKSHPPPAKGREIKKPKKSS